MAIESGLPRELLVAELSVVAIDILNYMPTFKLRWNCPYFMLFEHKPSVAHFKLIGAKVRLVGWDSTNIWRIWLPQQGKIIRTRDVMFLRDSKDSSEDQYATAEELLEVVEIPDENSPTEEELAHALLPHSQVNKPGAVTALVS
ncbi:hypothetical protein EJ04DRAFT_571207 [Polyplosphaeria fusca]|uniref:Retroviral polymerase SH3-like domain-containing protein n=1 Tax=Polyplosphaeria fusca TaxID=682080 RepID=A0A9P4QFU9_9PLEO|nr:hypothetical protein EJ04DRAFT_571207 [Polyplosphaeria fusca]